MFVHVIFAFKNYFYAVPAPSGPSAPAGTEAEAEAEERIAAVLAVPAAQAGPAGRPAVQPIITHKKEIIIKNKIIITI